MIPEAEAALRTMVSLPVPPADLASARATADRLRHVTAMADHARTLVEDSWVHGWTGSASTAYLDLRGHASGRLDGAARFAQDVATAIDRYADDAEPALAAIRRSSVDYELALAQRTTAADVSVFHAAAATAEDARARHERATARFEQAGADLTARLSVVPTFPDQPRTVTQHAADGLRRLWGQSVTEPLAGVHVLALGWVDDPAGWRSMVSGIPAGLWDQLTHPRQTVDELLAGPDWRNGQYGAALGTAASMAAIPAKALRTMASPEIRTRYARNMADPNAPKPRVQTVDEMLAGIRLADHEHHALGHAIRRHVDVDDDYLRDRLDNGTLLDDGYRSKKPPPHASSWNDLETAERATTYVLRNYETDLRKLASGEIDRLEPLLGEFPESLGKVMSPDGDGVVARASGKVKVIVDMKDGRLLVVSTYLEP